MKTIAQFRKFKIGKKSYDFEYAGHRSTKEKAQKLAKERRKHGYARVIKKRVPNLKWNAKKKKMDDIGKKKEYFVYEYGRYLEEDKRRKKINKTLQKRAAQSRLDHSREMDYGTKGGIRRW